MGPGGLLLAELPAMSKMGRWGLWESFGLDEVTTGLVPLEQEEGLRTKMAV